VSENTRRQEFTQHWLAVEPSVSAYVFAAISGFHDAEDVVQQVAQDVARRFDQYDSERPFLGWALWIAKSRVIDFYRKRKRDHLVFSDGLLQRLGEVISEQAAERCDQREALEHCLDGLPERSRHLLDLRYVDDLYAVDIAQKVDLTVGSVRVLLTRIRKTLSDCVQRRIAMEES
jgi:RNA polymerase sigma-70 factor (ECF subfamily)